MTDDTTTDNTMPKPAIAADGLMLLLSSIEEPDGLQKLSEDDAETDAVLQSSASSSKIRDRPRWSSFVRTRLPPMPTILPTEPSADGIQLQIEAIYKHAVARRWTSAIADTNRLLSTKPSPTKTDERWRAGLMHLAAYCFQMQPSDPVANTAIGRRLLTEAWLINTASAELSDHLAILSQDAADAVMSTDQPPYSEVLFFLNGGLSLVGPHAGMLMRRSWIYEELKNYAAATADATAAIELLQSTASAKKQLRGAEDPRTAVDRLRPRLNAECGHMLQRFRADSAAAVALSFGRNKSMAAVTVEPNHKSSAFGPPRPIPVTTSVSASTIRPSPRWLSPPTRPTHPASSSAANPLYYNRPPPFPVKTSPPFPVKTISIPVSAETRKRNRSDDDNDDDDVDENDGNDEEDDADSDDTDRNRRHRSTTVNNSKKPTKRRKDENGPVEGTITLDLRQFGIQPNAVMTAADWKLDSSKKAIRWILEQRGIGELTNREFCTVKNNLANYIRQAAHVYGGRTIVPKDIEAIAVELWPNQWTKIKEISVTNPSAKPRHKIQLIPPPPFVRSIKPLKPFKPPPPPPARRFVLPSVMNNKPRTDSKPSLPAVLIDIAVPSNSNSAVAAVSDL